MADDWTHRQKIYPEPDPEWPKFAQPLYGFVARMLVEGGHKSLSEPVRLMRDERGIPRRPKVKPLGYPGEEAIEPDPNVSDIRSTGVLINAMVRRHWSPKQVLTALSDPQHIGGEFFRFEADQSSDGGEGFVQRYCAGSYVHRVRVEGSPPAGRTSDEPVPPIPTSGGRYRGYGKASERSTPVHIWRTTEDGFDLRVKQALTLAMHAATAEEADRTRSALIERGPISARIARSYLDALTEHGVLSVAEQDVQTKRGKRKCRVSTLAEVAPRELVDRIIWKQVREMVEYEPTPGASEEYARSLIEF